jgi:polysaccharide biosynthesis/export protein
MIATRPPNPSGAGVSPPLEAGPRLSGVRRPLSAILVVLTATALLLAASCPVAGALQPEDLPGLTQEAIDHLRSLGIIVNGSPKSTNVSRAAVTNVSRSAAANFPPATATNVPPPAAAAPATAAAAPNQPRSVPSNATPAVAVAPVVRPSPTNVQSLGLGQEAVDRLRSLGIAVNGAPNSTNVPPAAAAPAPSQPRSVPSNAAPAVAAAPIVSQSPAGAPPSTNVLKAALVTGMETLDEKHKLAIGDRLSFRVVEDEEDPRPMIVTDSGDLEVPYLGRFPAEGKTCKQLAREIKAALQVDYYHQATVIVAVDFMAKSRGKVYVVGPVRAPGPQEIPSDETLTLSKAIMRAGGFGDYADKQHVKVTRKGVGGESDKQSFVVDVGQIFEKGNTDHDLPLQPGDLIIVPERLIRF